MEQFPTDLIAEIFSRLPSKSVARFCTLSKYWESTLRSREFAELFLTRSSTRPRLMFAVEEYGYNRWQFFSTPQQPQDQSKTTSLVEFHSKFRGDVSHYICSYASGLFCFPKVKIADENAHLVCNPITGLYVRLPYLERYGESRAFLGFDPIDKQFKVIKRNYDHCILTLGTTGEELSWRSNKTIGYEHCATDGICINGIVYWLVLNFDEGLSRVPLIVCCDVKTEEFSFINAKWFNVPFNDPYCLKMDPIVRLVNYKGKLGGIDWKKHVDVDGRSTVELCMWVLEDVENQEWVNYVYTLPENEIFSSCGDFSIAGVTATGEIVLVMKFIRKPFYVFYFSPERNTLQSVEIQGFGADLETAKYPGEVHVFVDHVEDLSLNNANQLNLNISDIKSTCPCCEKEAKKEKEKEKKEEEEEEEVVEAMEHL